MDLDAVKDDSRRYGPIAYVATSGADGDPHLAPVAVSWVDGVLHAFVLSSSQKVRNVRANPRAAVHFAVSEATGWDSCIVWGDAAVVDTTEGRTALWERMGYDLSLFEPGGPSADTHVFLAVTPTRATVLRRYGIDGRDTWHA
jgi:nitroimidazol reductase NimA-like FMN-containing flavoprotein (pyridoxamine 5'-phosphate oxidase superfamily)